MQKLDKIIFKLVFVFLVWFIGFVIAGIIGHFSYNYFMIGWNLIG